MRLHTLIKGIGYPARSADLEIYLDRYVNDAKGPFHEHSDVSPRFDPPSKRLDFLASYVELDETTCEVCLDMPTEAMREEVLTSSTAKFVWHPSLGALLEPDGQYMVAPTSSTRTLRTIGLRSNMFIKTHLDKRHFRFIRRLRASSVRHSVKMSREIREATEDLGVPFLGHLPEDIGVIHRGRGIGVLYRGTEPRPFTGDHRILVPYFSLYSVDGRSPRDPPLLWDLVRSNGGKDPVGWFVHVVVGLLQDAWALFVRERGVLLELHGQNTLAEIDSDGRLCRVVVRDFQSLYSDQATRLSKGLVPFEKHIAGTEDGISIESQYSLVFDHFISTYLIERITKTFVRLFPVVTFKGVAKLIRDRFRSIPGNRLDVFPPTIHRFAPGPLSDNRVDLEDPGLAPLFR